MEIGQELAMFTPNDDITDMSNKTALLATSCTQMVSIHDIISGKVPFPHLNNSKKFAPAVPGFQTQVQDEADIIIPAPVSKRGTPKAMSPQPNSTNLSIPENNNISIRPGNTTINTWTAVSPKGSDQRKGKHMKMSACLCLINLITLNRVKGYHFDFHQTTHI